MKNDIFSKPFEERGMFFEEIVYTLIERYSPKDSKIRIAYGDTTKRNKSFFTLTGKLDNIDEFFIDPSEFFTQDYKFHIHMENIILNDNESLTRIEFAKWDDNVVNEIEGMILSEVNKTSIQNTEQLLKANKLVSVTQFKDKIRIQSTTDKLRNKGMNADEIISMRKFIVKIEDVNNIDEIVRLYHYNVTSNWERVVHWLVGLLTDN